MAINSLIQWLETCLHNWLNPTPFIGKQCMTTSLLLIYQNGYGLKSFASNIANSKFSLIENLWILCMVKFKVQIQPKPF